MKKICFLLLLTAANFSFAQVKLQGVVRDSLKQPLELASIVAFNQETKALESYGVTNELGKYSLSLKKNITYKIQISYVAMKTLEESLVVKEADMTKDYTLYAENSLDAIELIYEMPVTIKGDTVTYNADSFQNGSERKLEDILANLPGVEINEDGQGYQISFQKHPFKSC